MFRFLRLGTVLIFLIPFAVSAYAEPELDVRLSHASFALDQKTELTVEIAWPQAEANYTFAFPNLQLENLTIYKWGESQEIFIREGAEWVQKTFTVIFEAEGAGPARIGAFELPYVDPQNQMGGRFTVEEQLLTVTQPPLKIRGWTLLYLAPLPVAAVLIIWSLRRRKKNAQQAAGAVGPNPREMALAKIKALQNAQPPRMPRDALHELNFIFREFLIEHYNLGQGKATDDELFSLMRQKNLTRDESQMLESIFGELREVKFMGGSLNEYQMSRISKDIIRFLESKKVISNPTG